MSITAAACESAAPSAAALAADLPPLLPSLPAMLGGTGGGAETAPLTAAEASIRCFCSMLCTACCTSFSMLERSFLTCCSSAVVCPECAERRLWSCSSTASWSRASFMWRKATALAASSGAILPSNAA